MKAYLHKQSPKLTLSTLTVAMLALTGCNDDNGAKSSIPTPTCTASQYLNTQTNTCVAKQAQTITFTLADMKVGDTAALTAKTSKNLAVTYSNSTPSVCTVANNTVTAVAAGDCTLVAKQVGNATTLAASKSSTANIAAKATTPTCTANQYLNTQTNTCVAKQTQTITFTLADMQVGDKKPLAATASSNLAVSYSSKTPAVCTVAVNKVTAIKAGDCTITATQAGNSTTLPVSKAVMAKVSAKIPTCTANQYLNTQTNTCVAKQAQTITFTLADMQVGDKKPLAAAASSGLAVSYASKTPSVCVIMNSQVEALKAGSCTVTASQAGNTTTLAATKEATAKVTTKPSTPASTSKLTATGITTCGDYAFGTDNKLINGHTHSNKEDCSKTVDSEGDPIPAGQDGHIQAGQKMSYTKLTRNGAECVKDNVTGLIWEQKVNNANSIRHRSNRFTRYDSNSATNGGAVGSEGSNTCGGLLNRKCNTQAYIAKLNADNYCGYSDWRLPTHHELISIIDYSKNSPATHPIFSNTQNDLYWSSSPYPADIGYAWAINFTSGNNAWYLNDHTYHVRAVR